MRSMFIVGPINLKSVNQLPHFPCDVSSLEKQCCVETVKRNKSFNKSVNDSLGTSLDWKKKNLLQTNHCSLPY
jgi:hypothetical protein